jgi:Ca2+-binding EF-hand superfamily protein
MSRTGRNRIVPIVCVVPFLVVIAYGAADAKRENDGDEANSLRKAVLARFDANHNGRLDSKEKSQALRELSGRDNSDSGLNSLRQRILAQFDKNDNGKLERSEIRAALATVNGPSTGGTSSDRARTVQAIKNDPSAAVAQQLNNMGYDTVTAQAAAFERFDLNGDGVLDASELALAQSLALQQLASSGTTSTSVLATPVLVSTSTSTGTTGTTTSTGSTTSGQTGGCSGMGSGSSGTSGSTGSTGITPGARAASQQFNNQAFGSLSFATPGGRSFGGGRGR